MRNVDKIKGLEKELGRYRKKVEDQQKEIDALRKNLGAAMNGNAEINKAVDAILAIVALKYGNPIEDDDTGEELGWRLSLPLFSVAETLEKYEIRTRRDEKTQAYIVGVMEKKSVEAEEDRDHGGA